MGSIATGSPEVVPDSDLRLLEDGAIIEIAPELLPPGTDPRALFALEVRGNGLMDAGLDDCDIVILQPVTEWDDGDILAVWLPERSEAVLTRLFREGDGYRLQGANATRQPILLPAGRQLEIKGKVVAMIRTLRE